MAWQDVLGHDTVVQRFRATLGRGRLASTYLFTGPHGIGKFHFTWRLAQTLLCERTPAREMRPCGDCDACRQVVAGTHPDLHLVEKPADKNSIPVEALIGDREHRMRAGFCHEINMKPYLGGRKIGIIRDADALNEEGANALLKTLEEPPPDSVLMLLASHPGTQLATIRSRCQMIRFMPLSTEDVARILETSGLVDNSDEARQLAGRSGGSIQRALELADPEIWEFRLRLWQCLVGPPPLDAMQLGEIVSQFTDAAGKASAERRERNRLAFSFAVEFFHGLLRELGGHPSSDQELSEIARRAQTHWPGGLEERIRYVERCLGAISHVDRNANQATLIEGWAADLGSASQGHRLPLEVG